KSGRRTAGGRQDDPSSKSTFFAALFASGEDDREEIAAAEGREVSSERPQQELRNYPASPSIPEKPETTTAEEDGSTAPSEPIPPPAAKPIVVARASDTEPEGTTGAESASIFSSVPRPFAKPRPASAETVEVASLGSAATAESDATTASPPQMAIAADRVPLPLSNPYRLSATRVAEAPTSDVPLPRQKPLVVASIPSTRNDAPTPIATAYEPAAGTVHGALETASASAGATASPASDRRRPSLPVLAFNGSRINELTRSTSAHTSGYARLSHPITASAGIFETSALTVETHFGSGHDAILDTDQFAGPAIKAVKTVWLD
ncbi:MAG: hypothetical protein KDJ16_15530, partial [Hyphomicrobiales bacterium]|nr:hypothetical protein [Hyphomicrobiales bacterium]